LDSIFRACESCDLSVVCYYRGRCNTYTPEESSTWPEHGHRADILWNFYAPTMGIIRVRTRDSKYIIIICSLVIFLHHFTIIIIIIYWLRYEGSILLGTLIYSIALQCAVIFSDYYIIYIVYWLFYCLHSSSWSMIGFHLKYNALDTHSYNSLPIL